MYFKEWNNVKIEIGKNSKYNFWSNCHFPNVRTLGQNKINRSN